LVTDVHCPGPQYLACSIRKAKHTCLGYRIKLSSCHTVGHDVLLRLNARMGDDILTL
jgi:hypothetical protein